MNPEVLFSEGQMILDAFRTVYGGMRFLFAEKPKPTMSSQEIEGMLERIRAAKAEVTKRYAQMTADAFADVKKQVLSLQFSGPEIDEIIVTLGAVIREAQPNPRHISALVGTIDQIYSLIAKLRGFYPTVKDKE